MNRPAAHGLVVLLAVMPVLLVTGCRSPQAGGVGLAGYDDGFIHRAVPPAAADPESVPLTLVALVNAAKLHNPEIVLLRDAMDMARAEAVTVTGLRNPEFRVEYSEGNRITERTWYTGGVKSGGGPEWAPFGSYRDRAVESDALRYTLRLYPPNPWLMRAEGGGARARFAAAAADLQAAEWRVECEIGGLLADISGLQRELGVVRKQVVVRRDYQALLQALTRQQQSTLLDALDAEQRQMRAEDDAAALEQMVADRRARLSELTGVAVQEALPEGGGVAGATASGTLTPEAVRGLRSTLVEARAEVMAAYWRHQDALALLRAGRVSRIPWFTHIQGSYAKADDSERVDAAAGYSLNTEVLPSGRIVSADDNQDEAWSVEAGMEIPVFGFHRGATRIQQANVRRCALGLREAVRRVQAEFDAAYQAWLAASARVAATQKDIESRRDKANALARTIDETDGLGPEARLKVQEMLLQLERTGVQAGRELDLAWWRLRKSGGAGIDKPPVGETTL